MSGNDFPNYSLIQFQNILTPFSGFCISFPPLCLTLYLALTHTHSLTNIQLSFFLWRDTRLLSCMTCDCYNSLYFFYGSWPLANFFCCGATISLLQKNKKIKNCHVDTKEEESFFPVHCCILIYICVCKLMWSSGLGKILFFFFKLAPFHWDRNSVELVKPHTMLNWNLN